MKTKVAVYLVLLSFSINGWAQNNTNLGTGAGQAGTENTSIGVQANDVVTGDGNTAVGSLAGLEISSGSHNTIVGYISGRHITTGTHNAFFGRATGFNHATGTHNTFIGAGSGYNNTTGGSNTFLGAYAGSGISTGSGNVFIGYYAGSPETGSNKLYIENSSSAVPLIYGDFSANQVAINAVAPAGYTFAVGGKAIAEEVVVKLQGNWPDYVFDREYKLPTFLELRAYIEKHKHLPGVPSAEIIEKDGLSVGEMNAVLLKKIEELTLYILEQDKRIQQLEERVSTQR